jgi:hypothetical protein
MLLEQAAVQIGDATEKLVEFWVSRFAAESFVEQSE